MEGELAGEIFCRLGGSEGPATIFQQVTLRVQGFPFRLLKLLVDASPEIAQEILDTPACLLDELSSSLLRKYNTSELLRLDTDLKQTLFAFSHMVLGTTFTTERLHSKHSRRNRSDTHAKTLDQFALLHSTWLGPDCFLPPSDARPKGPIGRPRKSSKVDNAVTASCPSDQPKPKKRKGGGGAWRAFIHHRCEQGEAANFAVFRDQSPVPQSHRAREAVLS